MKPPQGPPEISFSRLRTYLRCPWLFHLVYDLGWRTGPNAPQALGHSLHRALAAWASPHNEERSPERLMEIYDEVWVNEGFGTPQETFEAYERGRAMLETFAAGDAARATEIVAAEKDFVVPIDGVMVRGTIDRIDRRADGSLEIIEYKTNAAAWNPQRRENDLQMTMYQIAVQRMHPGTQVHLTYVLLSNGERHETSRTDEQRRQALELARETALRASERVFEPNFTSCPACEFRLRCEKLKNKT